MVGQAIFRLEPDILNEVYQEVLALETKLETKMNEVHHTTATHLQEIKDLVVAVQESQQKMWGSIEKISKDLQELV